jgi:hypothetical protein
MPSILTTVPHLILFSHLSLSPSLLSPYLSLSLPSQPMIDNAREEQDVRDLSNFLALLLKGAEVSNGKDGLTFCFIPFWFSFVS